MHKNLEVMDLGLFKNTCQIYLWSGSDFTFTHIFFTPVLNPLSFGSIEYGSEEDVNTDKHTNMQFSNYDFPKILMQRTCSRLLVPWLCRI